VGDRHSISTTHVKSCGGHPAAGSQEQYHQVSNKFTTSHNFHSRPSISKMVTETAVAALDCSNRACQRIIILFITQSKTIIRKELHQTQFIIRCDYTSSGSVCTSTSSASAGVQ
jgi:hypothetical protein